MIIHSIWFKQERESDSFLFSLLSFNIFKKNKRIIIIINIIFYQNATQKKKIKILQIKNYYPQILHLYKQKIASSQTVAAEEKKMKNLMGHDKGNPMT